VTAYLNQVLDLGGLHWHTCGQTPLPVYLDATFETVCTELVGTPCAFKFRRTTETPSPMATTKQLAQLATLLERAKVPDLVRELRALDCVRGRRTSRDGRTRFAQALNGACSGRVRPITKAVEHSNEAWASRP